MRRRVGRVRAELGRWVRAERGSASIWVLGIGLAVVSFAALATVAGGALVARHRARNAADLGALAGALRAFQGEPAACGYAGQVVAAQPARMVDCVLEGLDLVVTAEVNGAFGTPVRVVARAGPLERFIPSAAFQPISEVKRDGRHSGDNRHIWEGGFRCFAWGR